MNKELSLAIKYIIGIHLDCSRKKTPQILSKENLIFLTPSLLNVLLSHETLKVQNALELQYKFLEIEKNQSIRQEQYITINTEKFKSRTSINLFRLYYANSIRLNDIEKTILLVFPKFDQKILKNTITTIEALSKK